MRAGILSTGLWGLASVRQAAQKDEDSVSEQREVPASNWDVHEFQRQQILGLVRQVFIPGIDPSVRHVVFSAVESETDVCIVSRLVAEELSLQTESAVAFLDESERYRRSRNFGRSADSRDWTERIIPNLFTPRGPQSVTENAESWPAYFERIRGEFEYSIVAAPPASTPSELFTMAYCADGLVLVLSAQRTRPAAAVSVVNSLGRVRLLGTVLCEREFPIPWKIYRRL